MRVSGRGGREVRGGEGARKGKGRGEEVGEGEGKGEERGEGRVTGRGRSGRREDGGKGQMAKEREGDVCMCSCAGSRTLAIKRVALRSPWAPSVRALGLIAHKAQSGG